MIKPHTAIILSLRRSFDFKGRSRRSEFWWFMAFSTLIYIGLVLLESSTTTYVSDDTFDEEYGIKGWLNNWRLFPISSAFYYLTFIPSISVGVRRLHDVGRRGWPMFIYMFLGDISTYMDPTPNGIYTLREGAWNSPLLSVLNYVPIEYIVVLCALLICTLYIFLMGVFDSHKIPNSYGASPKYGDPVKAFD